MLREGVSVVTLIALLTTTLQPWGYAAPAASAKQPKKDAPSLFLIPEETLEVYRGGPAGDSGPASVTLPEGRIVLAQAATTGGGSTVGGLTEDALAAGAAGNSTEAVTLWLAVLSSHPHSHEAKLAAREVGALAETLSAGELDTLVDTRAGGLRLDTAPAALGMCLLTRACAGRAAAGDAEYWQDRLAADSEAGLRAWPNAPEAHAMAGLLAASPAPAARAVVDKLIRDLPGTLAAWRLQEITTGAKPDIAELATAEAKCGLLEVYVNLLESEEAASPERTATARAAADLGHAALFAHADSPVTGRVASLWYEAAKALPWEERAETVNGMVKAVNASPRTFSAFATRAFLHEEFLRYRRDLAEAYMQTFNQMDARELGVVEKARAAENLDPRDAARLDYLEGMAHYNLGFEQLAVKYFDAALARSTSDAILEYARYARGYSLEGTGWYAGDMTAAADSYSALLAEHPRGKLAGLALYRLGQMYGMAEDYESALPFYEAIVRDHPSDSMAPEARRAVAELRGGDQPVLARRPDAGSTPGDAPRQICGPVALRGLLQALGVETTVETLAQAAGTDATGTSMLGLLKAAKALGVDLHGVQTGRDGELAPPFIAFVNGNHFVLVREGRDGGYTVVDVDGTERAVSRDLFRREWDGKALVTAADPGVVRLLHPGELKGALGGQLPSNTYPPCRNNHNKCKGCCPSGPGGGGGPGSGNGPRTPGGNENVYKGFNPDFMPFQSTFQVMETDISVPVSGGMSLMFFRLFSSQFGMKRGAHSVWFGGQIVDLPYRNNIGESWSHNFNMHLRISQDYGYALFMDHLGNAKGYMKDTTETDPAADYYYCQTAPQWEAHGVGYKGEVWEQGIVLKRWITGSDAGKWVMYCPDGTVCGFAQETAWDEHYSRLEYTQNASGARLTLTYDTGGRLSRVDAPQGDGRALRFSYAGPSNRIWHVELLDGQTVVQSCEYVYNAYYELVRVATDDDYDPSNDQQYGYDVQQHQDGTWSFGLASYAAHGNPAATITQSYEDCGEWGWQATDVTVTQPNLLKRRFQRNASNNCATLTDLSDTDQVLAMQVIMPDWYMTTTAWTDVYLDPGSAIPANRFLRQRWQYTYDTDHFRTAAYGPADNWGATTYPNADESYTYNSKGNLATLTRQGNNGNWVTTWTYDASGLRPATKTDPDGLTTEYTYDTAGRLIQEKHPSLGANGIQYSYDSAGNLLTVTDPLGNVTTHAYDARGNRTSTTNPLNQTTTLVYDDWGRVVQVTDPLGKSTYYEHGDYSCGCGGAGKVTEVTDALNNATSFVYDDRGNLSSVTDAMNVTTDYFYDDLNRLTRIVSPSGSSNEITHTYDRLGRLVSTTDMAGRTTTKTYDHLDRVLTEMDSVGTVSYAYDPAGNLSSVTDSLNHVTSYTYLPGGLLDYTVDPVNKYVRNFYDSAGRLIKTGAGILGTTDPTEYFYSATTGRLTKTRYWVGSSYHDVQYTYDAAGRTTRADDWLGNDGLQYAYDAAGRLSYIREYVSSRQVSYTYDAAGRVATLTDHTGAVVSYTYTDTGRVASVTAPGGKVWSFAYNALGMPTQYTHPNNTRTEYAYDTRHRLTGITHRDLANNAVLDSLTYTLNAGSEITRMDQADGTYWWYGYGGRGRLTGAVRRNALLPLLGGVVALCDGCCCR